MEYYHRYTALTGKGMLYLVLASLPLLMACSAAPLPRPEWAQGEDAIKLIFHADPELNYYQNQPHSVTLSLFQLEEPNAFQQLLDKPKLRHLLLSMSKDLPSSLSSERFYLMPGETRVLRFNRAEKAKWILVVAGYFDPLVQHAAEMVEINYIIHRDGLISGEHASIPEFERIIYLGPRKLKVNLLP